MISRIATSLAMMLVLFAATIRLPASPCVLTNTASEKACQPVCCANKVCCATSHQRTGSPVQPATKASPDQQITPAVATTDGFTLALPAEVDSHFARYVGQAAHSPPTLALICIRLI
jgi:hypothetical protein